MHIMLAFLLLLTSGFIHAQANNGQDTMPRKTITPHGKPVGPSVERRIGKDGGGLSSHDGRVELLFPNGALAKNTTIHIQAVKNNLPNGHGFAYQLEPSGLSFRQPVQIIFHYDPDDSPDSAQLLLGIGMQDESGQWYGLTKFNLDTVAKTISGDIRHFSTWSTFDKLRLHPEPEDRKRVKVNKTLVLRITGVTNDPPPADNADELMPLDNWHAPTSGIWRVNGVIGGNGIVGKTVTGRENEISMSSNVYTAPATVPDQNPVSISLDLVGASLYLKGLGKVTNLRLVTNILVFDNAYEVSMITSLNGMAGSEFGRVIYSDTGSLVVSLNGKKSKVIEKVNRNTDAQLDYNGKCTITKLKAGSGNIHIVGTPVVRVSAPSSPASLPQVEIIFQRTPMVLTLLQATCPSPKGPTTMNNAAGIAMMSAMAPAYPMYIKFIAKDGEQVIEERGTPGGDIYLKVTVRQLKDDQ